MTIRGSHLLVLSAVLVVALAGTPAARATPSASSGGGTVTGPVPQDYPPVDDPAGNPCPFPLHIEFPVNRVVAYTHTDAKGRVTEAFYRGALFATITRTDTGASVTKNLSGDGVQRFARNGASTMYGIGPFSVTLHPGDRPGPELALLHGASALRIAADGRKTILYSSRIENICTELS